jgi:hypothetical protein
MIGIRSNLMYNDPVIIILLRPRYYYTTEAKLMMKSSIPLGGIVIICSIFGGSAQGQPEVGLSSLLPSRGPVGTVVLLKGSGFTETCNTVHFGLGGKKDLISSNGGTEISYTIPSEVGPCDLIGPACSLAVAPIMVTRGQYPIYVTNARGRSETLIFEVSR